nr:zinc finger protein zat3 [Quercus suber]
MDIDEQENQLEEMEKVKGSSSLETLAYGENKRPKATKESESDQNIHQDIRICDFCGKTFNGGKALGGHRRSHLQAMKLDLSKNSIKKHVFEGHTDSGLAAKTVNYDLMADKLTCCICNKDFPSTKSLSGHMRSHPDRDWRGIQPPSIADQNSPSSSSGRSYSEDHEVDDDDDLHHNSSAETYARSGVDLLSYVSNWSKSDKRGRKCIGSTEAAQNLMCLSRDKSFFSLSPYLAARSNSRGKEEQEKHIVELTESKKTKGGSPEQEDLGLIDDDKGSYKCSDCGKPFPTFQALGGHRSSHNKEKKKQATNALFVDDEIEEESIIKTFPMNGGLDDGHRRCDSTGLVEAPTSSEVVSPGGTNEAKVASSGEVNQSGQRILDFDLNQPCNLMEDEGIESTFNLL